MSKVFLVLWPNRTRSIVAASSQEELSATLDLLACPSVARCARISNAKGLCIYTTNGEVEAGELKYLKFYPGDVAFSKR